MWKRRHDVPGKEASLPQLRVGPLKSDRFGSLAHKLIDLGDDV